VPLVRGRSRSRPLNEIIAEAGRLAAKGFKEIVLTGICLGAYGQDLNPRRDLVDVINELEKIDGLLRIRLSSIEAQDVSGKLIRKMSESKKLCRHLHIPIQSGDDKILKMMNRKYSAKYYLNLINKLKRKIPDIAITTDCLVGFSGETEKNFQHTLGLVRKISPLKVHIFPYSKREGTFAASHFNNKIDIAVARERIAQLKKLAEACTLSYKNKFLNKSLDVLFEGRAKKKTGYWQGHAGNYIKVLLKSTKHLNNQIITVRLRKIENNFILADL
jgi:threonylcarbamoyladenosine tRNA methylthiotransferase MtaB